MPQTDSKIILKYFPDLDSEQIEQIRRLYPLYADWNSKINVISRKDMDSFYLHHVLHSLAVAKFIKDFLPELDAKMRRNDSAPAETAEKRATPNSKQMFCSNQICVMDVGCGGGFPGIPLAIFYPSASFLLVDSIGKKVRVAQAIADEIGLVNVKTLHGRAEEVNLKEHLQKDKADLIVSRAVTSLGNFIPWVKDRYTEGILYLKGGSLEEEIAEAQKKCRIRPSRIFQKDISDWFADEYFQEKKVLFIK